MYAIWNKKTNNWLRDRYLYSCVGATAVTRVFHNKKTANIQRMILGKPENYEVLPVGLTVLKK